MRTDIKVGAVVAVVLVAVFVVGIWIVKQQGAGQPAAPTPGDVVRPETPRERTNVVEPTPPAPGDTVAASRDTTPPAAGITAPPGDTTPGERDTTPPPGTAHAPAPGTGDVAGGPADTTPPSRPVLSPWERPFRTTVESTPAPDTTPTPTPSRMTPPPSDTAVAGPTESVITPPTSNTYTVKAGDSYWSIAQHEWGDGSLHKALEEANPNVPSDRLRPGLTIKLPARPSAPAAPGLAEATAAVRGKTAVDAATGKRYYVVKQGDNGFWGISQAVYGTGNHWKAIETANSGLDPRRLSPGQKVWLPSDVAVTAAALPAGSGPARPGAAAVTRTLVESSGSGGYGTGAPATAALPGGGRFD